MLIPAIQERKTYRTEVIKVYAKEGIRNTKFPITFNNNI